MFLLTFALLVISMLGVYTQVYALEAARIFASQSGVGQTMLMWHTVAAGLAANVVNPLGPPAIGPNGCRLTKTAWTSTPANAPPICSPGSTITVTYTTSVTADSPLNNFKTAAGNYFPQWPAGASSSGIGYNTSAFQFNSVAFLSNGDYYVATFVSAPAATKVSTASPATLNLTESDLFRQLQNLQIPPYSYGYVANNGATATMTPSFISPSTYYTVTLPLSIPDGALVIVSAPGQCNGC